MLKPSSSSRPRRLLSHASVTTALRGLWVVLVIAGELGLFYWSLSDCRWPTVNPGHPQQQPATNVLLLADPQLPYPVASNSGNSWSGTLRRTFFELNLRKSWHVTSRLKPDLVIFLGDMLANGRFAKSYQEFEQAAQKFKSIFPFEQDLPVYFIPGNNDVGLGSHITVSRKLRSYYTQFFGATNQQITVANHTLILLDAPALVDEDYQRHAKYVTFDDWKPLTGGPVAFVKEIAEYNPGKVILFSHIPLSRPEGRSCGSLRERAGIRRMAGPGYQSMLGKQTTNFLLRSLQPLVVFSADNRDYCDYKHIVPGLKDASPSEDESIREVTLKSFSPSIHINRPGFQLLSLIDANQVDTSQPGQSSFADRLCLLPDQGAICTSLYLPFLIVTMVLLVLVNIRGFKGFGMSGRSTRPGAPLGGGTFGGFGGGRKASSRTKVDRDRLGVPPTPPSRSSSGRASPNNFAVSDPSMAPWSPAPWSPFSPTMASHSLRTPRTSSGSTTRFNAAVASSSSAIGGAGGSGPGSPTLAMPSIYNSSSASGAGGAGGMVLDDQEDHLYPHQYAQAVSAAAAVSRRESYVAQDEDDYYHHPDQDAGYESGGASGYSTDRSAREGGDAALEEGTQVIEMRDYDLPGGSLLSPRQPRFISAPGGGGAGWKEPKDFRRVYSYTFVFMGRRRRLTFGTPTWGSLYNVLDLFGFSEDDETHPYGTASGRDGGLLSAPPGRRRHRKSAKSVLWDLFSVLWPALVVYMIINWMVLK